MVASLRIVRDDAGKKLFKLEGPISRQILTSHRESAQLDLDLTTNQVLRKLGAKLTLCVTLAGGPSVSQALGPMQQV